MSEKIKTSIHPSFKNFEDYLNKNQPKYGPWKENVPKPKTEAVTISAAKDINDLWKIDYNITESETINYAGIAKSVAELNKNIEVLEKDIEDLENQKASLRTKTLLKYGASPSDSDYELSKNRWYSEWQKKYKELTQNIDSQINQKKQLLEKQKSLKYNMEQKLKFEKYDKMLQSEDFKKFIESYDCETQNGSVDYENIAVPSIEGKDHLAIVEYLMKNSPDGMSLEEFENNLDPALSHALRYSKFMTSEQKMLYHYIYKTYGIREAEKYVVAIEDSINYQEGIYEAYKFLNGLDLNNKSFLDGRLANTFDVSVEGLGDGINKYFQGLENAIYSRGVLSADDYKIMIIMQYLTEHTDYYDNIYSGSISVGNMIPTIAINALASMLSGPVGTAAVAKVGETISTTLWFASIFGNTKNETLASGESWTLSVLYALANAGTEVGLEKFLGNIPFLSSKAGFTLKGILMEGVEEYAQTWIDAGYRSVIFGEEINLDTINDEALESFWMGCIISGVMNSPDGIIKIVVKGKQVAIDVNQALELISSGMEVSTAISKLTGISKNMQSSVESAFDIESNFWGNENALKTFRDFIDPHSPNYLNMDIFSVYTKRVFDGKDVNQIKEEITNFITDEKNFAKINNSKNMERSGSYQNPRSTSAQMDKELKRISSMLGFRNFANDLLNYINPDNPAYLDLSTLNFHVPPTMWGMLNLNALDPIEVKNSIENFFKENKGRLEDEGILSLWGSNKLDELLSNIPDKNYYGVPQNILTDMFEYRLGNKVYTYYDATKIFDAAYENGQSIPSFVEIISPRGQELENKLIKMGYMPSDARIILKSLDSTGACSYATVCNEIIEHFKDNPDKFEETFGYPITNADELLLDIFLFANDVNNEGALFDNGRVVSYNMSKHDPTGGIMLDTDNQTYLADTTGQNEDIINKFLKSKNPNLTYESSHIIDSVSGNSWDSQKLKLEIFNKVLPQIASGKHIHMGFLNSDPDNNIVGANIEMIALDGGPNANTKDWDSGEGHSVTITEVQSDGIIVSSWGRSFKITYDNLAQGARFMIGSSEIT